MAPRTIRTIDDLAQLPDDELLGCLNALRMDIVKAKGQHAMAFQKRADSSKAAFGYSEFLWRPKASQRLDTPSRLVPDTLVEELVSIRPSARRVLSSLGIFRLEDLSAISEEELLREEAIGPKTVCKLREALSRLGLDFLASPDISADRA